MFTRDALLLIGHGSTVVANAARPLLAHAAVIRQSNNFAEVAVCTLLGEPDAASVIGSVTAPVIHVVPFFLEDGYFTRFAIPDLLMPFASATRVIRFCQPVGAHKDIAALMGARLIRHCEMFGIEPKAVSVLLIGHGSGQHPGRARMMRRHAATLDGTGHFGWVRMAFLEEAPFVAEALASTRGHIVAAIGYLANEGVHATRDLPNLIAEERGKRGTHWPPVHDLGLIGGDEAMPRLITDQVVAARGA